MSIKLVIIYYTMYFCDRKIKVWDLQAALDPRAPAGTLCLRTLVVCCVAQLEYSRTPLIWLGDDYQQGGPFMHNFRKDISVKLVPENQDLAVLIDF